MRTFSLFILVLLFLSQIHADNFKAQSGPSTYQVSSELQKYVATISTYVPANQNLKSKLAKTIAYYKKVHIVKTIYNLDSIIDCVPYAEQPALINKTVNQETLNSIRDHANIQKSKEIKSSVEECPLGTVAILRPSKTGLTKISANQK